MRRSSAADQVALSLRCEAENRTANTLVPAVWHVAGGESAAKLDEANTYGRLACRPEKPLLARLAPTRIQLARFRAKIGRLLSSAYPTAALCHVLDVDPRPSTAKRGVHAVSSAVSMLDHALG